MTDPTGLQTDESCAHCMLGEHLGEFMRAHPNKCRTELIAEMVQLVGEVTASCVPAEGLIGFSVWLQGRLLTEIREAAKSQSFQRRGLS